jgi:hypothetical protein
VLLWERVWKKRRALWTNTLERERCAYMRKWNTITYNLQFVIEPCAPASASNYACTKRDESHSEAAGNESDRLFCSAGAHIPFNARSHHLCGWSFSKASPLHWPFPYYQEMFWAQLFSIQMKAAGNIYYSWLVIVTFYRFFLHSLIPIMRQWMEWKRGRYLSV